MRRRPFRSSFTVLTAVAAALLLSTTSAQASAQPAHHSGSGHGGIRFTPGAAGIGDSYFPLAGNGGFDVRHYNLDLAYDPPTHGLTATATISARATQNLSRFDLDLQGLTVQSVSVNGLPARFTRDGQELVITPRFGLLARLPFSVKVRYSGSPETIKGSPIVFGSDYGWIYTDDGVFVGCEPNAASTWYPSSDHPADKASFSFAVTVPNGLTVAANGRMVSQRTHGATTTFRYDEAAPMATYLATIDIGRFTVESGRTPGGIKSLVFTDPALPASTTDVTAVTGAVTDYWSQLFGRYPFDSTGAIVDNTPVAGFSLETQTRPLYSAVRSESTIAHELAHQWFGDDVSVQTWQNIWLNEGFATFSQWLWSEHTGVRTAVQSFQNAYDSRPATAAFWTIKVADPQRDSMFASAVYQRGAMTLEQLRLKIGDADFFQLLRTWVASHRYGNGTTAEFTALAQHISGQDLTSFFTTWLLTPTKPTTW